MIPDLSDDDLEDEFLQIKSKEHQCKIFGPLNNGKAELLGKNPMFQEFPAKVDHFIGRFKEMYELIENVNSNRLVTVIGLPGVGKTALVKNTIHFMFNRQIFKNGIILLSLKGVTNCEIFLKKLITNITLTNLFEKDTFS